MKMTFLGTGGAFSRMSVNYHNNALIEMGPYKLLLDCGSTALESLDHLESFDGQPEDVDGVLITHLHADHIGGLEELAFRGRFLAQKKFDLIIPSALIPSYTGVEGDGTDLWENSLKGGLQHLQTAENEPLEATLDTYFNVYPVDPEKALQFSGNLISFFPTRHVPNKATFGVRIDTDQSTRVLFTADAKPLDQAHYEWADKIFHDCSLTPKYPSTVHTHFEDLKELPEETRAKMSLMHYGDPEKRPEDLCGMELVEFHSPYLL